MKRLQEDAYGNCKLKRRLSSSRGESFGQQAGEGGGDIAVGAGVGAVAGGGGCTAQKPSFNDALTYLKQVKDVFHDQREKYESFLYLIKDFKEQRIDTIGVITRVKQLFKGHNNLIFGFNTFLSKGYEITVIEHDEPMPAKRIVELDEAISFVNKIKKRFHEDGHVYMSFLDILNLYRKEQKGVNEVYNEVASLFVDHPDLLDEFNKFLPAASATSSAHHEGFDERSSVAPPFRPRQHDKQRGQRDRVIAELDPSVDCRNMGDNTMMKSHKEQKRLGEKDSRDQRNDQGYKESDIDRNRKSLEIRKSEWEVEDIGVHPGSATYDIDAFRSQYSREFTFIENVKNRLGNLDDYEAFLKCLHIYSTEIITRKELHSLVSHLLAKHPDLMEGFSAFLEHCKNIGATVSGQYNEGVLKETSRFDHFCDDSIQIL